MGAPGDEAPPTGPDDGPVLADVASDDLDVGWGDDPNSGHRDDEWYQRERPPHHDS